MKKEKTTKKKKLSTEGMSMKEKMLKRKKALGEKGKGGGLIFPKEGTLRFRIKNPGDDSELGQEIIQFYLGPKMGGVISPATYDEPCPFMEKYQELKKSKDEDDQKLAKQLVPKRKFILCIDAYKDEKGRELDPEKLGKGLLVSGQVYEDIIDLYLDEEEWGDMTDKKEGYDLKLTRSGSGQYDTKYQISPCQKKPIDSSRAKPVDLEAIVRKQIPSYEELEEKLDEYLCGGNLDEDEDDKPKKKKVKSSDKGKKKKKKSRGGEDDDLPF